MEEEEDEADESEGTIEPIRRGGGGCPSTSWMIWSVCWW